MNDEAPRLNENCSILHTTKLGNAIYYELDRDECSDKKTLFRRHKDIQNQLQNKEGLMFARKRN